MSEQKGAKLEQKGEASPQDGEQSEGDAPKLFAPSLPAEVVVHPLVLLSVVDHYNRVAKDTKKRVVGVLLGETHRGKVDITNSYAVPFEEDMRDPSIWYLDHIYHENMFGMFKKVNAKEKVVGWYSTGPKIRPADLEINELFRRYTKNPVLCIIDVNPTDDLEIPTQAYLSVESKTEDKTNNRRTFVHLPCEIGAYEAEEVGVEHLLRDIRDTTESTLADQVTAKLTSLKGLHKRLEEIYRYLMNVENGRLPVNHQIVYNLQDIFNLIPNLQLDRMVKSFAVKTNDDLLVIYLSSLVRSILALHDLIENKVANREHETKERAREAGIEADESKTADSESKTSTDSTETDENSSTPKDAKGDKSDKSNQKKK